MTDDNIVGVDVDAVAWLLPTMIRFALIVTPSASIMSTLSTISPLILYHFITMSTLM